MLGFRILVFAFLCYKIHGFWLSSGKSVKSFIISSKSQLQSKYTSSRLETSLKVTFGQEMNTNKASSVNKIARLILLNKKRYGSLNIPANFTSEKGLVQSDILDNDDMLSYKRYNNKLNKTENCERKLVKFINMLKHYRRIHRNVHVPQGFQIPASGLWPRQFWFYKLGSHVNRARKLYSKNQLSPSTIKLLEALGFVWNTKMHCFDKFCECVKIYRQLYGNATVLTNFVVPKSNGASHINSSNNNAITSGWPKEMYGYHLGHAVLEVRRGKSFATPAHHDQLKVQDLYHYLFEFNNITSPKRNLSECIDMLEHYRRIYHNVLVPQNFQIPASGLWPRQFWLYKLGTRVAHIRVLHARNQLSPLTIKRLEALRFVWNEKTRRFDKFCECLKIYRQLYGNATLLTNFVVPKGNDASQVNSSNNNAISTWPEEMHGYHLGQAVLQASKGYTFASPAHHDQLKAQGLYHYLSPRQKKVHIVK